MSYTYLLEGEEEYSAECFSDIPASVLLRLNLTHEPFCSKDSETESCRASQSGTILEHSMEDLGGERSMSSAEGFLVRTFLQPEKVSEFVGPGVAYGLKCYELLARLDPVSSFWKVATCFPVVGFAAALKVFLNGVRSHMGNVFSFLLWCHTHP